VRTRYCYMVRGGEYGISKSLTPKEKGMRGGSGSDWLAGGLERRKNGGRGRLPVVNGLRVVNEPGASRAPPQYDGTRDEVLQKREGEGTQKEIGGGPFRLQLGNTAKNPEGEKGILNSNSGRPDRTRYQRGSGGRKHKAAPVRTLGNIQGGEKTRGEYVYQLTTLTKKLGRGWKN